MIRTAEDYRDVTYEYLVELRGRGRAVRRADRVARPRRRGRARPTPSTSAASPRGSTTRARDHGIEAPDRRRRGAQPRRRGGRGDRAPPRRGPPSLRRRLQPRRRRGRLGRRAVRARLRDRRRLRARLHRPRGRARGAESVRGALALPVTRISHGVRAIEDPALVAELAERAIVLEVCPTSNVRSASSRPTRTIRSVRCGRPGCGSRSAPTIRRTSAVVSAASMPWRASASAWRRGADRSRGGGSCGEGRWVRCGRPGCGVTLGSDDPPYFGCSIGSEYAVAHERLGLDEEN